MSVDYHPGGPRRRAPMWPARVESAREPPAQEPPAQASPLPLLRAHTAPSSVAAASSPEALKLKGSVLKKRRRKMNRHKYKKWRKKMKPLMRKLGK